jgi:EmrB/QacA subfamily drug resistance transporter
VIDARQRRLGFLVAGCFFMEILDGTIVSTAAPRIGAALHVPATAIGLVITAYLVTLAVLIPLSGWMVSRFGTRQVFLTAIVIFTVASLMCATSSSLGELVAWRILQGIGGAMMVPVGRLAVLGTAAKSDLMRMISFIVWPALVAPVIAPLAGGFITTYASWHWLFLINVPLGAAAFMVAIRMVPSLPRGTPPRLDWAGVLLTCLALGGLTYAASLLSQSAPSWATVAGVGVPAAGLLVLAVRHLLRVPDPLIDLRTLRVSTFRVAVTSGSLSFMAVAAVPFLLPLLFETVFGWSAVKSGALVLFVFVGNIGIKPATSYLLNRYGFRTILIAASVTLSASVAAAGLITSQTPVLVIIVIAVVSGVARSVGGTSYNTLSFCDIPGPQMPHANSLSATTQQLSLGLGVAAATIALRLGGPIGRLLPGAATTRTAYTVAFVLIALLPLGTTLGIARLHRDAGSAARTAPAAASPAVREQLGPLTMRDQPARLVTASRTPPCVIYSGRPSILTNRRFAGDTGRAERPADRWRCCPIGPMEERDEPAGHSHVPREGDQRRERPVRRARGQRRAPR